MTDTLTSDATGGPDDGDAGAIVHDEHWEEEFGHATDFLYIKIAFGLAFMTAMEVGWPYFVDDGLVLMVPLLTVMAIKFVMIAAFFMHLKFDKPILTRVFYGGLFLAVAVYVVTLATFHYFRS